MPTLYHVPAVHTAQELGINLNSGLTPNSLTVYARHNQWVLTYWEFLIPSVLRQLRKDNMLGQSSPLHIFVEGYKDDDRSQAFLCLAAPSVPMFHLAAKLLEEGGEIHVTEDEESMRQQAAHLKSVMYTPHISDEDRQKWIAEAEEIVTLRDKGIAKRIEAVLQKPGDSGILILGAGHDIRPFLPVSIDVKIFHRADILGSGYFETRQLQGQGVKSLFDQPDSFGHIPRKVA